MKVGENNLVTLLDEKTIVKIIPQELLLLLWASSWSDFSPFYENIVCFTI